jgi:hypothetical protein
VHKQGREGPFSFPVFDTLILLCMFITRPIVKGKTGTRILIAREI